MTKKKSLLNGIGNESMTEKYYDDWALNYDLTLKKWNYKAPKQAVREKRQLGILFSFNGCSIKSLRY